VVCAVTAEKGVSGSGASIVTGRAESVRGECSMDTGDRDAGDVVEVARL
jgi:hypothetical protein